MCGLDPVWRCPIGGEGQPDKGGNRLGFRKGRHVRGKEGSSCTCFSDCDEAATQDDSS